MSYRTYKTKLEYLHWLISHQSGDSEYLARKLSVSQRTIKRMINNLRDEGNNIEYCYSTRKYLYHLE
jgi:biotin operon repressor